MNISTQAREYLHRPEFLSPFVHAGFNSYEPAWDTGVDFILIKEFAASEQLPDIAIKVQLKSRWTIERKYIGRQIWIAFPDRPLEATISMRTGAARTWYLMPHDLMVQQALVEHGASASFKDGHYSKKSVPKAFYSANSIYYASNLLIYIERYRNVQGLEVPGLSQWPELEAK